MVKINKINKLSRRRKIFLNLALFFALLLLRYVCMGCPPISGEDRFRKAELEHGLGPAEILADISIGYDRFTRPWPKDSILNYSTHRAKARLIIASSEKGYTLYTYWDSDVQEEGALFYREKEENGVTICPVPGELPSNVSLGYGDHCQPLVVFDDVPEAVTAKVWIGGYNPTVSPLTSTRKDGGKGYFVFVIPFGQYSFYNKVLHNSDVYIIDDIGICYYDPTKYDIFFYDKNGDVIDNRSGELFSAAIETHMEKTEKPTE